jgi:uncharacterized membrane protein
MIVFPSLRQCLSMEFNADCSESDGRVRFQSCKVARRLQISESKMQSNEGQIVLRDRNPNHWKLLVFYYNTDEPRLFVAKRTGSPMALNYAKPMAWAITSSAIAALVLLGIIGALTH